MRVMVVEGDTFLPVLRDLPGDDESCGADCSSVSVDTRFLSCGGEEARGVARRGGRGGGVPEVIGTATTATGAVVPNIVANPATESSGNAARTHKTSRCINACSAD
jgi:hypothetical protein